MDASQRSYTEIVHSGPKHEFFIFYAPKVSEMHRNTPKDQFGSNGQEWMLHNWRTDTANQNRGGSEWELIKILLEGDGDSNKMNTASNTRLRLTTQVGQGHVAATGPRNQHTTFRSKTHQHAQRKLARLAVCAAPVRPMTCAGQTGDTGQTGGLCRSGRWLQQPHNKRSKER
jgi:hypothetical protein